jgi:aspartate/methionine/tyrosine aminotransferase
VWADIVFAPNEHTRSQPSARSGAAHIHRVRFLQDTGSRVSAWSRCLAEPEEHRLVAVSHADETAYGVSTLSQVAGIAALERADHWLARFVAHLEGQRDHAVARLNRMDGVRCHLPEGTYVVFPDVSSLGIEVEEIAETLRKDHAVAVVPGSPAFFGPGARGHLRLSLATSRVLLDEGLDRLQEGLRLAYSSAARQ